MLAVLAIFVLLQNEIQAGILYPRASESRETLPLDGIWKFIVANRSEQSKGFENKWYQGHMEQVNYLLKK